MSYQPGDVIRGKYRVKRLLGEGGMGIVVRALHLKLDQDVALKLLRPEMAENANVVERFAREAKAAARLKGNHVVRILDVEEGEGGAPFIVMEYLEGTDLDRLVRKNGPLPPERATAYALQACEGLAEAHALGIVHRDVKPANLFLAKTSRGGETVKLLDFGISKARDDRDPTITEADRILGSPSFMSPEQVKAARDVDARTDVWSLGVVLYFLLSGRLPFAGDTATAVAARIASEEPAPIDEVVPSDLRSVVLRCLEKDRDARFASIDALASALAPFTEGGAEAAARVASLARMASAPPAATSGTLGAAASSAAMPAAARVTASLSELAPPPPERLTASVDAPAPVSIDKERSVDRSKSVPPPSEERAAATNPWPRRVLAIAAAAIVGVVVWTTMRAPVDDRSPTGAASLGAGTRGAPGPGPTESLGAVGSAGPAAGSTATPSLRATSSPVPSAGSTGTVSPGAKSAPGSAPPSAGSTVAARASASTLAPIASRLLAPPGATTTPPSARPNEDPLKLDLK